MFVKICGVRNSDELRLVERYADATGVVVNSNSKRRVPLGVARELIGSSRIPIYLVSTMASFSEWANAIERTGAEYVQIHSDAHPKTVERLVSEYGVSVMKAFTVPRKSTSPGEDAERLMELISQYEVDRILLDTGAGSGRRHDYRVSAIVAKKIPIVLAGGLRPENVEEAVKWVRPAGVDVSSGVERNGVKDRTLIEEFIGRVRNVVR
ncbi:MAG: phosphoribosylanthranilate isomerase [Thermococcus sp.]|nr:phosphoribosylanthranilate isomerase [Thermococcus sp.]